jgi:hypothetical protein
MATRVGPLAPAHLAERLGAPGRALASG